MPGYFYVAGHGIMEHQQDITYKTMGDYFNFYASHDRVTPVTGEALEIAERFFARWRKLETDFEVALGTEDRKQIDASIKALDAFKKVFHDAEIETGNYLTAMDLAAKKE